MVLFFPHDHRYRLPTGERWRFFYLCLNGREVLQAWREVVGRLGPIVKLSRGDPVCRSARASVKAVLGDQVRSAHDASRRAYELAMLLLDHCERMRQAEPIAGRATIRQVVERAERSGGGDLTVEQLAAMAGYSRFHFSRLFRESEGMSPHEFLIRLRLRRAVRLLQTTDHPLKWIASETGFGEAAYFCRVFKRSYGVTPGAFRQSGVFGGQG